MRRESANSCCRSSIGGQFSAPTGPLFDPACHCNPAGMRPKKAATFRLAPDKGTLEIQRGLVDSSGQAVNPRELYQGRVRRARLGPDIWAGDGGRARGGQPPQRLASRPHVAMDVDCCRAVRRRGLAASVVATSAQPRMDDARPALAQNRQPRGHGPVVLWHDPSDRAGDAVAGQGPVAVETRARCRDLLDRARAGTATRNHERPVLMTDFLAELWRFMRVRKKFWLLPILIMMVVFGGLVVLTKGTVFAPFIYTLF